MDTRQKHLVDKLRLRDAALRLSWNEELKAPAIITGALSEPFDGGSAKMFEKAALELLDDLKPLFRIREPAEELKLTNQSSDSAGNVTLAFKQVYQGIPVYGAGVRIQFGTDKAVNRIMNKYVPGIQAKVQAELSLDEAISKATEDAGGGQLDKAFPPELFLVNEDGSWTPAWTFRLALLQPPKPRIIRYFINAEKAQVMFHYDDLQSVPDVSGNGTGYYSGGGAINSYFTGSTYQLIDNTRVAAGGPSIRICDLNGNMNNPTDALISEDSDNQWNDLTVNPRQRNQGPEVDALRYLGMVVDYYRDTHHWNSFNNQGSSVYAGVHFGINHNNAYWNGSGIVFGDGDNSLLDYTTTVDIVAHEFTHGVTQHTAGLAYYNQSGGLNESFSDIFAIMVDREDFEIAEDCVTPTIPGDAGRTMSDPSSNTAQWRQPNHVLAAMDTLGTGYYDGQDPHDASGYLNFAAYLLIHGGTHPNSGISVNPIGHEKAEKIFFHTLSVGLLGNSLATFVECREAALNAVNLLYKNDAYYLDIMDSVKNAFTAVGIGPDIYIRDSLNDTGIIPSAGTLYMSPDIIIRNELLANPGVDLQDMNDAGLSQDVEAGQDNYVYLRLQNRGSVSGNTLVRVYWSEPSSFSSPANWHLIGSLQVNSIEPDTVHIAGPITWAAAELPPLGHFCLVAELDDPLDPAPDKTLITTGEMYNKFISRSNNFAWKNINVIDMIPGGAIQQSFSVQGPPAGGHGDLLFDLQELPGGAEVRIRILKRLCENVEMQGLRFEKASTRYNYYMLTPGQWNYLKHILFKSNEISEVQIYVNMPEEISGTYKFQCCQQFGSEITSRITHVINLMGADAFDFIANSNSKELHRKGCIWITHMNAVHKVGYHSAEHAHRDGYDNCAFCLGNSSR